MFDLYLPPYILSDCCLVSTEPFAYNWVDVHCIDGWVQGLLGGKMVELF